SATAVAQDRNKPSEHIFRVTIVETILPGVMLEQNIDIGVIYSPDQIFELHFQDTMHQTLPPSLLIQIATAILESPKIQPLKNFIGGSVGSGTKLVLSKRGTLDTHI